jgi:hypothetical protein
MSGASLMASGRVPRISSTVCKIQSTSGHVPPGGVAFQQLTARRDSAVRPSEFLVAIPAPVLPHPREEAAQALHTRLLPDHEERGSASGTFHIL